MDIMLVCVYVIAMTVVVMAYMGSIRMLSSKAQISQVARKYILRMETVGYLTDEDREDMEQELWEIGAQELDFTGTTLNRVEYGTPIFLVVRGRITVQEMASGGRLFDTVFGESLVSFEERKMSTAKN